MSFEFLTRLQKELSLTGSAVYESVITIAEHVNRKVHVLRLHGQATSLLTQIEELHGEIGRNVTSAFPSTVSRQLVLSPQDLAQSLTHAADRIQRLKQTLGQVDNRIRDLKLEAIHEDLLHLQRDLSMRSAAIERLPVAQDAYVAGKSLAELAFPASLRVVIIFRGPFLIPPADTLVFRPDDVVIVVGLQDDLTHIAPWFKQKSAPRQA